MYFYIYVYFANNLALQSDVIVFLYRFLYNTLSNNIQRGLVCKEVSKNIFMQPSNHQIKCEVCDIDTKIMSSTNKRTTKITTKIKFEMISLNRRRNRLG